MANSRKHQRFSPLLIRADYSLELGDGVRKGYVTNLSQGGAFLATREDIPVGTGVRLLVSLPWQMGQFEVNAKAAWRREQVGPPAGGSAPGVGLEFVDIDAHAQAKLRRYLERFQELAAGLPASVP